MNTDKLKGLMAEVGQNQKDISDYWGSSLSGFRLKLKGTNEFKASEIKALADLYGVPTDYFFSPSIAKIATKEGDVAKTDAEAEKGV